MAVRTKVKKVRTGSERRTRRRSPFPLLGIALLAACGEGVVHPVPEGSLDLRGPWVRVQPDQVGLDPMVLAAAVDAAEEVDRMRSLLVIRRGGLALEWYGGDWNADTLADVRSVTKSVVSILTGIALQRGDLERLEQPIGEILTAPEFGLSDEQQAIKIQHLLTMTGGFRWDESTAQGYNDWVSSGDPLGYLLDRELDFAPGSTFTYNSAAVFLLGIVLEEAVGRRLQEYADDVLFGPLGIDDRAWEEIGRSRANGGSGIDLRPRDLARLGQLVLQEGWSGDRQVVPSEWIEAMATRRFDSFGSLGPMADHSYGFLWFLDLEHDAVFAWGHGGQFVYVLPDEELVVVVTTQWQGASRDIEPAALQDASLRIVVDRVLPAVR